VIYNRSGEKGKPFSSVKKGESVEIVPREEKGEGKGGRGGRRNPVVGKKGREMKKRASTVRKGKPIIKFT